MKVELRDTEQKNEGRVSNSLQIFLSLFQKYDIFSFLQNLYLYSYNVSITLASHAQYELHLQMLLGKGTSKGMKSQKHTGTTRKTINTFFFKSTFFALGIH